MYQYNHTAKVTPLKPLKQNNYIGNGNYIIERLKYLIAIQSLLGVSRLYLLEPRKIVLWISYCYSFTAITFFFYSLLQNNTHGATYIVFKCTSCIEFLILVFTAIFLQRKTLREFFKNVEAFDRNLNITKDIYILFPTYRNAAWLLLSIVITIAEVFILTESRLGFSCTNLTIIVHDAEEILFCTLLRAIMLRVSIVKAHVMRVCHPKDTKKFESLGKIETISTNVQLDISSLHEVYESLHKCSEQINSVMSFPMMTMLLSSGLSTIILLKYAFAIFQAHEEVQDRALLLFIFIRCWKYTALVIIPCYYSSMTTTQVSIIRKTLHDALHNTQFDRIDCRKLKAFFQLTRDSEFAYALWGVINLNMSLPLSYISLCTTYLVIIIQFSKFID